jgi:ADP-heptose:LPS heptosyltransferase
MRPDRIALLDRWVSKPVCALLSLFERVRRAWAGPPAGEPRKILFVKLIEMGSTVLACPAFEEAARRVGRENLYILVFAPNRAIVDVIPYFDSERVITVDDRNLFRFVFGLLGALVRIRRLRIDTAIDMEGLTSSSAIITWLSGAKRRVGFYNYTAQGPYRGRLFTHELNYTFQHHISKTFVALVRAAFASPDDVPLLKEAIADEALVLPEFAAEDEERERVRKLFRESTGREPGRIVILNPNCSDLLPLRRWPTERFVELGKRALAELPDCTVAVTGAPSEAEEAQKVAAAIGPPERVVCLAGRTTLRELLVLYTLAELMITNDSGPVHFASLTQVRLVALFGPETPVLYGPLGARTRALTAGLACSPCVNMLNHRASPCTDNQCMQQLDVDRVWKAAQELLAS